MHHVDPTKKEFGIGAGGVTRAWSKVLVELDKCVLLCKNCHGEVHSGLIEMSILSEILRKDLLVRRRRAETIIKNSDLTRTVSEPRECDCGKIVSKGATRCMDCYRRTMQTKIDWPPVDELLSMIESTSYAETGRKLGVSDNAVRKRLKRSMG